MGVVLGVVVRDPQLKARWRTGRGVQTERSVTHEAEVSANVNTITRPHIPQVARLYSPSPRNSTGTLNVLPFVNLVNSVTCGLRACAPRVLVNESLLGPALTHD